MQHAPKNVHFRSSASAQFLVAPPGQTLTFHHNLNGYRLGGGFDFNVAGNFFARAEYRFSHYDAVADTSRVQVALGPGGVAVGTAATNIEAHTGLFGAYYKFR